MKTKTMYSTNPNCLVTYHEYDDQGNRTLTVVKSRYGDAKHETKCETVYLYDGRKKMLACRTEMRDDYTRSINYPALTGGRTEITETYYHNGKGVFSCQCDSKGEPIPVYMIKDGWNRANDAKLAKNSFLPCVLKI